MLRKIVHIFFIIIGATLGFLYFPNVIHFFDISDIHWITSPYFGLIVGAVLFSLLTYLLADYVVGFLKWIEEGLMRIPVVDLFFGTVGLILGLFVAYLINIPIQDIGIKIVSEIVPLFLTIIIGYLGFQVVF